MSGPNPKKSIKISESNVSKGLGDDVEKITHSLGLDEFAKKIATMMGKDDCGCQKRKEFLNRIVPYKIEKK